MWHAKSAAIWCNRYTYAMFRMLCEYKQQAFSVCHNVSGDTVVPQLLRYHVFPYMHDVYCLTCAKVHVSSACSACLWYLQLCGATSAPSRMTWCLLSLWSAVYVVFLGILGSLEICHLWLLKCLS